MDRPEFLNWLGNDLIDTHCHLTADRLKDDIGNILQEASTADVKRVIDIAIDLSTSEMTVENSNQYSEQVFACAGIDPELLVPTSDLFVGVMNDKEFQSWLEQQQRGLRVLLENNDYLMIGECGIDNYWLHKAVRDGKLSQQESDRSLVHQQQLFTMQCELAEHYHLPISIHSRSRDNECLQIIKSFDVVAIFHSFTGGYKVATKILDAGHFLGVNGIVTYPSANNLRSNYQKLLGIPATEFNPNWYYQRGIVFETDAPWLNPFDAQKLNTPAQVKPIAEYLHKFLQPT